MSLRAGRRTGEAVPGAPGAAAAPPAPWALSGEGRGPRRHGRSKSGARRRPHLVSRSRWSLRCSR